MAARPYCQGIGRDDCAAPAVVQVTYQTPRYIWTTPLCGAHAAEVYRGGAIGDDYTITAVECPFPGASGEDTGARAGELICSECGYLWNPPGGPAPWPATTYLLDGFTGIPHTLTITRAGYQPSYEPSRRYSGQRARWHYQLTAGYDVIFDGDDLSTPPEATPDEAALSALRFLTLRPGDTDADYFARYTPEQAEWCAVYAEDLALVLLGDVGVPGALADLGAYRYRGTEPPSCHCPHGEEGTPILILDAIGGVLVATGEPGRDSLPYAAMHSLLGAGHYETADSGGYDTGCESLERFATRAEARQAAADHAAECPAGPARHEEWH